jgi:5-methylcytosine-specific restriction endonuclease McrA
MKIVLAKKLDRKYWVKKLDDLAREVVKARDKVCVRCGKKEALHCAHILPKGKYTRLRWDTDNLLLLCYACHFHFVHKNPLEAAQWLKEKYPIRTRYLRNISQLIDRSKIDYAAVELFLKEELKKY